MRELLGSLLTSMILLASANARESLEVPIPDGKVTLQMTPCSDEAVLKLLREYKQDSSEWFNARVQFKHEDEDHEDIVCWRVDLSRPGWAAILNRNSYLYRFRVFEPDGMRL